MDLIDLRSDTVTKPSHGMRQAMANAEVGDDVYGEDPTVRALEEGIAGLLGKPAALFVTSGTMANQLAVYLQTRPGDEVIVGEGAHVMCFESGAGAALSGVQFRVAGHGGLFDAAALVRAIRPKTDYQLRTALVALENTHNLSGGRVFPAAEVSAIAETARGRGLACHLDGARLWNASAATGASPRALAAPFDTVAVCFSKGLGAPVGSALAGSRDQIVEARRVRKMLGGGMRQAGILAGAALYALEHHLPELPLDHEKAMAFACKLRSSTDPRSWGARGVQDDVALPETNIVNINVRDGAAPRLCDLARRDGVLLHALGPGTLRVVMHRDITLDQATEAAQRLARTLDAVAGEGGCT